MAYRIAIFTCEYAPYPGGIASYTRELARAAFRLGHKPVIFAFVNRGKPPPDDGFEVVRLRPDVYNHKKLPWLTFSAARELGRRSFDVAFAADLETTLALSPIPTRAAKLAAMHGTDVQSKILLRLFSSPLYRALDRYRSIFVNSNFTRDLLLRNHPYIRPELAKVAFPGVGDYWFEPTTAEQKSEWSLRQAIPPGKFVLASVGRLEPRKGQSQAIAAIARLPEALRSAVVYLIVGRPVDGAYHRQLQAAAAASGADVRILGDVPDADVRAVYRRANLLLHTATKAPERVEGFGLVLLEAAAAGLPALATNVDALPEVVRVGESGFLAPDRDVEAIAAKIAEFVADPSLLSAMAAGCKTVAEQFTWERCARTIFV